MTRALQELAVEMTFPPSIAELVERADEISGVGWLVAWKALLSDLANDSNEARRALTDDAHAAVKIALKDMGGWSMLRDTNTSELHRKRAAFRAHYLAAEREVATRNEHKALPEYADYEVIADYSRR